VEEEHLPPSPHHPGIIHPNPTTHRPTPHTGRRHELMAQLGAPAANGPALLEETFGPPGWADGGGRTALAVHLPACDGYGLHRVASNAAFIQRFYGMAELHSAFLHHRTLHFALSAL
jgi:hypothetical protein